MAILTLKNLHCFETEDFAGADEPYLRVNGSTKWSSKSLNTGQDVDLFDKNGNPLQIAFNGQAVISLYDSDGNHWYDRDDFLGSWTVTNQEIGRGDQLAFFNLDGASYQLAYEVTI
ncbi:hypothetical protein [Scytonema sp. NUACC26]|uniref:hypothetical protein n=1 Tax=Scytonema sp. NUACC26 TaxID=3140176 RepID=UPI0034DC95AD